MGEDFMKIISKIIFGVCLFFTFATSAAYADIFTTTPQDVTAYTASKYKANGDLRLTHSSKVPTFGFVAVRKNASNQPHVPFGSTVSTPSLVDIGGYGIHKTSVFASTQSYYAIDIWWDYCRTYAYQGSDLNLGCSKDDQQYKSARTFGEKSWILKYITY
jgi:hypothetical protein